MTIGRSLKETGGPEGRGQEGMPSTPGRERRVERPESVGLAGRGDGRAGRPPRAPAARARSILFADRSASTPEQRGTPVQPDAGLQAKADHLLRLSPSSAPRGVAGPGHPRGFPPMARRVRQAPPPGRPRDTDPAPPPLIGRSVLPFGRQHGEVVTWGRRQPRRFGYWRAWNRGLQGPGVARGRQPQRESRRRGSRGAGRRGRAAGRTRAAAGAAQPSGACGAQNVPTQGESDHPEEDEMQDCEDSEEDLNWELEDGMENSVPAEQKAELPVKEDWDNELIADQGNPYGAEDIHCASIQEFCLWAPRAQQGDMIYDPSWHHPAPLTPHYSKMVFETGQFDDAED
ncbi:coordinator of PRMT5 and differentiation stimulator [Phascolarctos cinereus]